MPSLGAFLRGAKFKKSSSETMVSPEKPTKTQQSRPRPPLLRLTRSPSISGLMSLNLFRKKDKLDFEIIDDSETRATSVETTDQPPQIQLNLQSISATNGLEALRINTTNSFRPTTDTALPSTVNHEAVLEERTSNVSSQTPMSISSSPLSSIPDSKPPNFAKPQPPFLTLPAPDTSFDGFNVNLDFAKFETTKTEPSIGHEPPPKRITNHDFLLLVDDGPGIDHRTWDTVCEIVSGVTKRFIHFAGRDSSQPHDSPPETPTISLRFVNNPRNIVRVQNLTEIRSIFNWVSPREVPRHQLPHHQRKPATANVPPLRTLEYHFWNLYHEKLQKNAWVGQNSTTIILFISSPLGNRPEDTDLFIAKCAEKLNADQVPLPLVSIMIVQCNSDPVLQHQLVDTRRMITWEWYTPRAKPVTIPAVLPGRKAPVRVSTVNPPMPEQKRRPQRDWVDIITCVDWEGVGGILAIKGMIEKEIQRGTQRRKKLQREAAMNYLTHLGKEDTSPVQKDITKIDNPDIVEHDGDSWISENKFHRNVGRQTDIDYSPNHHHHPIAASLGAIHTGRIDYYD